LVPGLLQHRHIEAAGHSSTFLCARMLIGFPVFSTIILVIPVLRWIIWQVVRRFKNNLEGPGSSTESPHTEDIPHCSATFLAASDDVRTSKIFKDVDAA